MKEFWNVSTTSFTFCILTFAILAKFDMTPMISEEVVFTLFVMVMGIAGGNVLTNYIEAKIEKDVPTILDFLIRIIECYLITFFIGSGFGMIPFAMISFAYITPVILPVFSITYIILYLYAKNSADFINKKIRKKKK